MLIKYKFNQLGFSLIELVAVVALIVIITAFAIPAYQNLILDRKINATTNELISLIALAKNTAITRNQTTAICAKNDSWRVRTS